MSDPTDIRKTCCDCATEYEPWQAWKKPGAAGTRCHRCYLAYTRKRQGHQSRVLVTHGGKPTGARWRALQTEVWQTETHCGICGDLVDQALHHNDPMSRSLDHITPIALGGAMYERSNVRLAHRSCNSRAGNSLRRDVAIHQLAIARAAMWIGANLH